MTEFSYEAADGTGRIVRGSLTADAADAALERLGRNGLFPIRLEAKPRANGRTIPARQLAPALASLASLLDLGLPADQAARTTAQAVGGGLQGRLTAAAAFLAEGTSLGAALRRAEVALPRTAAGILEAGERGGRLAPALRQAAELLERDAGLRERIQQALMYPMLLLGMGGASLALILGVVVPRFASMLGEMGQSPPWAAALLFGASSGVRRYGPALSLLVIVAIVAAVALGRRERHRAERDRLLLRLPIVGEINFLLASSRIASALGAMSNAGMPLLAALSAALPAAANDHLVGRLRRARERVASGERLAQALGAESVLWEPSLRLVAVGEANGRLAEMALKAGDLAQAEAERRTKVATSLVEPVFIVGFALLIGFVAAALLQAVYALRPEG